MSRYGTWEYEQGLLAMERGDEAWLPLSGGWELYALAQSERDRVGELPGDYPVRTAPHAVAPAVSEDHPFDCECAPCVDALPF